MKKTYTSLLFLSILLLASCASGGHGGGRNNLISSLFNSGNISNITSNSGNDFSASIDFPKYENIDIDLTKMNATMVYSQVNDMLSNPTPYVDKVVKMKGPFKPYESTSPDYCYPAIVITDATACCGSGIEFLLYGVPRCSMSGGNGYPSYNEEATIVGVFKTYIEDFSIYVHLVDAVWLKDVNQ